MMRARALVLALVTGILFACFGMQAARAGVTGVIMGHVVDKETREPLIGVNVVVVGTNYGAATDQNGRYTIRHVPAGVYTLRFDMIGYAHYEVQGVRVVMDLKTTVDAELEPEVLELGRKIVVTAQRPLIQPDVTGTIHFVSGSKVEVLPVDNFQDVVAMQPGITADMHIRGGRETEVLYLVDGIPIQQAMRGGAGSDLPNASIVEVSVQTGGFDAEYGNAMSGVVNVVTKSGGNQHQLWLRALDDRLGIEESNHRREYEIFGAGPIIRDRLHYFYSCDLRLSDTRWWQDMVPVFGSPIEKNFNLVSKLTAVPQRNLRLTLQALYSDWDWHEYEYRWRYNLTGLPPRWKRSLRLSASLTHTVTDRVFYTLRLSRYRIDHHMGQGSKEDVDPSMGWQYELPWYYFVISGKRLWWQDATEIISIARADFVAYIGEQHKFKSGVELQWFDLENDLVKYEPRKTFWGRPLLDKPLLNFSSYYHYKPRQGAFYLQDKYDNGFLIATLGLRYDFLDPRARRPMVEWVPVTEEEYEQKISRWVPASVKRQWSPRLGLSWPAGPNDRFFVNFGYFFQVPLFDYLYTGLKYDLKKGVRVLYGNPDLKPEKTKAWEFGYKHAFPEYQAVFGLTYFNKEMENLVDTKTFLASDSKAEDDGFTQYVNLPAARSHGWEFLFEKRYSNRWSARISYSLMYALGYSGSAQQGLNYWMWGFAVPNKEYWLSWDQRHTVVAELFYGVRGNYGIDLVWRWHSPRPYTYYPSRTGFVPDLNVRVEPNNARMYNVSYLDLKLRKELRWRRLGLLVYLDIRNLLDRKNVLWVASDGRVGGELGDPSAWDVGRRFNLGVRVEFGMTK